MEQISLAVTHRERLGTRPSRQLRRTGQVPAVVYGHGKSPVSINVAHRDLLRIFHMKAGSNVIINLKIGGATPPPAEPAKGGQSSTARTRTTSPSAGGGAKTAEERTVIVKEIQYDPVQGSMVHIDFHQISLKERLKVSVPIALKGEAVGVKQDGGLLEHFLREVAIECLPTDIPPHVEIDVSALKIGDAVHVRDIATPEKVKIVSDPALVVLSVLPPHVEAAPEAAVEAPAEPELIRKKKDEEGAEAAPAEGAKTEAKPEKADKAEPKKEGK